MEWTELTVTEPNGGRRVSTGQAPGQEVSEPGQSEEGIPNGVMRHLHSGHVWVSEPRPVRGQGGDSQAWGGLYVGGSVWA